MSARDRLTEARILVASLPRGDQLALLAEVEASLRPLGRHAGLTGEVAALFAERGAMTTYDVICAVRLRDGTVTTKQVYDAIKYLVRRGAIRRAGWCNYKVTE